MRLPASCLLLVLAHSAGAAEFHVSPSGDDAHAGTVEEPFRSLDRARDEVRRVSPGMTRDVVVYLHGGRYALRKTVEFGPRDSGRGGHKVIYRAAEGETPILTGGVGVTDWRLHDAARNIHRARVASGTFRQIYIDGHPAIRAREPDRESEVDNSPYWPCTVAETPKARVGKEHWKALDNVPRGKLREVEMVMVCHWYHQRIRVGETRDVGDEIEITPVNPSGKFNKVLRFYQNNRGTKNPFYFENALAFVDEAYEWYHDPEEGALYLALPEGGTPDGHRIETPTVETLVTLRGDAEKIVRDIEFRGLTFECTNWAAPSRQGVNMTQGAQPVGSEKPPAMIEATHARRIALRDCAFRNAGAHGIGLFDVDASDIEGNDFSYIAANGIDIDRGAGRNPPPEKQSSGVAVWNNRAVKCGNHYTNGDFLLAGNVRGLIVEHNLIHDMPYSGMQIGQQPGKMQDVGCGDNRIRYNHIHHCNQVHGDGGGIYTLGGVQKGTVIAENFVHDIRQSSWDHYKIDLIYLDNHTSKVLVRDNVVNGGRAAERNGSAGNTLINNTQSNPDVEAASGIKPGYDPRKN